MTKSGVAFAPDHSAHQQVLDAPVFHAAFKVTSRFKFLRTHLKSCSYDYMKTIRLVGSMVVIVGALFATGVEARVPANFPGFSVTRYDSNAVAPGSIFLSVTDPGTNRTFCMMILTNNGTPLWYQAATNGIWDFKPLPDGELHYGELFTPIPTPAAAMSSTSCIHGIREIKLYDNKTSAK